MHLFRINSSDHNQVKLQKSTTGMVNLFPWDDYTLILSQLIIITLIILTAQGL